jgi:hypothetical protein
MNKIITESSLKAFFFNELMSLNQTLSNPVSQELIYYGSNVMSELSKSENFFDLSEGKIKNKSLGEKLLASEMLQESAKVRALKDIGDTSLIVCSVFEDSFNPKIIDRTYYIDLGKIAYGRLNNLIPVALDIEGFYMCLSKQVDKLIQIMKVAGQCFLSNDESKFILNMKKFS